jgi:HK97 family phage prohead protease
MKPEIKITRNANGQELRRISNMSLRAIDDENDNEDDFAIEGNAVAYNVRSSLIGGQFYEVVAPGAFSDTLRADDQVCCFNHDANQILGRKKSGTLTLRDGNDGLRFRCALDRSNPVHQAVHASIKRGDVDGCSFQFNVPADGDTWEENSGIPVRTLKRVKLFELGPVVFPAYTQTSVGARAEQRADYVLQPDWRGDVLAKLRRIDAQYNAHQDAQRRSQCEQIAKEIAEGK